MVSTVTFTVTGLRRDAGPARQVVLPYFDVALRGGTNIAAKQIGDVASQLPGRQPACDDAGAGKHPRQSRVGDASGQRPGDPHSSAQGGRARRGDRSAVRAGRARAPSPAATFEHLVGFQLTRDQLKYNATR